MSKLYYKDGYKYRVEKPFQVLIKIKGFQINHEYFILTKEGVLTILKNYCWDGATMFPDLKSIMRASCVHDCLYQMIRLNLLPNHKRDEADEVLRDICIEDGMWKITAAAVYKGVRIGGGPAAYGREKPVKVAP